LFKRVIECVPNFSEGTNEQTVFAIRDAISSVEGVKFVDLLYEADYNRSVMTFIGPPAAVLEAVLAGAAMAIEKINMEKHKGQHPRIGAVDVVPFVPIQNVTMQDCIDLSIRFGEALAERHQVPIYFYEETAAYLHPDRPERRDIDYHRRNGEYEGLKREMANPDRKPDRGPQRVHPTAGATLTGARELMVGVNINLSTPDLRIAKQIAKRIRQKTGGLANVKAMGTKLEDRGITQIGISNVNFRKTPIYRQIELTRVEAWRYGVSIVGTEIIGVLPLDAILDSAEYYMQFENMDRNRILEMHYLE
jgi:glutamate formiminotransferase